MMYLPRAKAWEVSTVYDPWDSLLLLFFSLFRTLHITAHEGMLLYIWCQHSTETGQQILCSPNIGKPTVYDCYDIVRTTDLICDLVQLIGIVVDV